MRGEPLVVVDSSVLVAIAVGEADAPSLEVALDGATCLIGAPTLLEAYLVLTSRIGAERADESLREFTAQPNVTVVPFDLDHFILAADAFRRFGKGRDHPARLNHGDCLAYAVAKRVGAPLLYKGGDFGHTDLASAPGRHP